MDLALNNQQRLICHKTQPNKQSILEKEPSMLSFPKINFPILIPKSSVSNYQLFLWMQVENQYSKRTDLLHFSHQL